MGMFCLNMLAIALELAQGDMVYEDIATKFFEHFLYIAGALNNLGGSGVSLWNEDDGFYYDVIHFDSGEVVPLRIRSLVGLIPLLAVQVLEPRRDRRPARLPAPDELVPDQPARSSPATSPAGPSRASVSGGCCRWSTATGCGRITRRLVDPDEFLSPHGVRSLSRDHLANPVSLTLPGGDEYMIGYEPAESRSGLFGGNSNWRGPVWFPINYLLFEAYLTFHHYHGGKLKVELPFGSGQQRQLDELAWDLSDRLTGLFLRDADGRRPVLGPDGAPPARPGLADRIPFYEYFDGDDGRGAGASHQTGWTALVAKLLEQTGAPPAARRDRRSRALIAAGPRRPRPTRLPRGRCQQVA